MFVETEMFGGGFWALRFVGPNGAGSGALLNAQRNLERRNNAVAALAMPHSGKQDMHTRAASGRRATRTARAGC
jgi:hypothetical protein